MITLLRHFFFFTLFAVCVSPSVASAKPSVLVNPKGHGTAKTIQEGIDLVDPGGKVKVLPGTYNEALIIDKALTLEAIGGKSRPVIIEAPGTPTFAIRIATPDRVVIRDLTLRFSNFSGIRGEGIVDVTVEGATVIAVNPPLGVGTLVSVANDPNPSGLRARLVVRDSFLDGSITCDAWPTACTNASPPFPQNFGVTVRGDVDLVVERNVIRRVGGACIFVQVRNDLGGETNAEILDNDLDDCHPLGRAGAIFVAPQGTNNPSADRPLTATGTVNIVGNTIRNSSQSCLTSTGINYIVFGGRIEHNRIEGVVQTCASDTARTRPAGIWLGSRAFSSLYPRVNVKVRFNDIVGNAQAGLRVAQNMTPAIDARCNWWNDASGPSGAGPGSGDALVVEAGADPADSNKPLFAPWAVEPIAESGDEDGEDGGGRRGEAAARVRQGGGGAGGEERESGAENRRRESSCD